MAIIKCKMCGGDLALIEGASTAECEYCGSIQTIPNLDDEKKLIQFERAERLRKQCEFDKAAGIYETIVADFRQEAEAYWGLVLCKYGIEYVDDPGSGKKIPTCHRSSFESIMDDSDFEQAMENADMAARKVYREEAKVIEEIRKGIIAVSSNEQPYDIFICYKETAEDGQRTLDSVLAQDVYDALTDKGYRVFFSRITLEDKLGVEYEPYIFAALNSAKVMLTFGTDYEYFNAVWVKNEWSRFLKLMAKDKEKHLIPCYKGIDAYDMPKEFAKLQAQDLGKVGATQDLLRGIEKILPRQAEPAKETVVVQQASASNPTVDSYLERAFMFLEDGDWESANAYCEKVLDIEPKNARAYLGKLMAELQVKKQNELQNLKKTFDEYGNYQKVLQFSDDALRVTLSGYIDAIKNRLEAERKNTQEVMAETQKRMSITGGMLSAGYANTVGVCSDGTVVAVGDNDSGHCNVERWRDIVSVSANFFHTVGLRADGTVVAVGRNEEGQCDVAPWRNIVAVSAGTEHTVGLCSDGTVVATKYIGEYEDYGQCNVETWENIVAIGAGDDHTVGLRADGTVVAVGDNENGQCDVGNWKNIVAISAGSYYTVGLCSDGRVVATEYPDDADDIDTDDKRNYGQCKVENWKNIVAVWAAESHTVGLKADGTVVAVGNNENGQCNVSDWKNIVGISAGSYHTVGLCSDGTVVSTKYKGDEQYNCGQCDVADWKLFADFSNLEAERITRRKTQEEEDRTARERNLISLKPIRERFSKARSLICASDNHTGGLRSDGAVMVTKYTGKYSYADYQPKVAEWRNVVAVSGMKDDIAGLRTDGSMVCCRGSKGLDWKDLVAVSKGSLHTVGLRTDGSVVAVNSLNEKKYDHGQCNVGNWKDIVSISTGWNHTVGLRADGTVVAVGENKEGQCNVGAWKDIVAISAQYSQTIGLRSDGTVVATGWNYKGVCNVTGWEEIVAICTGEHHTVGLRADGTVVAVGGNEEGQCNVDAWRNIVAISAGAHHTVGLRADGVVVTTKYTGKQEDYCGQCDVAGWKLFDSLENLEEEKIFKKKENYRKSGRCQHCGGELKGLFSKKCISCGRPKDY